jgi:hypothetical protein
MKLLDEYLLAKDELFKYFGYVEDWASIPFDDCRTYFWSLREHEDGSGDVYYADTIHKLANVDAGEYYHHEIYTQRHLPKWVYRGKDHTMISCNTHVDGNKFLCIFSNHKEIPFDGLWEDNKSLFDKMIEGWEQK